MSALIQLIEVTFSHGEKTLFEKLNLTINHKEKIALVGFNGCGKSTLLTLLRKILTPDEGEVRKANFVKIGHVDQFVSDKLANLSAVDAVLSALPNEEQLLLQWKAESQLMSLGFSKPQLQQTLSSMSGGQQNLVLIARALINEPDLLLMDEPGNHMDIKAMLALENFLIHQCPCAVLMISHDAQLLDKTCQKTIFIRDKQSYEFNLKYSEAKQALEKIDSDATNCREQEEKEIERLQKTAKRLAIWGHQYDNESLSRKSKSILKRVDKLEQSKTFVSSGSNLKLSLSDQQLFAKQVLAIDNLKITIPNSNKQLFEINHLSIKPGDRIAIIGENGCGKSTTLEFIRKQYQDNLTTGLNIRFNPRTTLGYYDQELRLLEADLSRLDWLRKYTEVNEESLKQALIKSGIGYKEFDQKVNQMSGGEKARMMFIAFSLNQPNLIILDEPTNHIDLQGKEELTEQLMQSGATLLITSHDRHFLDQIATRWLCIENKQLLEVNSPDQFYERLLSEDKKSSAINNSSTTNAQHEKLFSKTEEILQRIEDLENKLAEDKKRKPKFQKPKLQQAWKEELETLWRLV